MECVFGIDGGSKTRQEESFRFERRSNSDSYEIKHFKGWNDRSIKRVVLPSEYMGRAVTSVGASGLCACRYIEEVVISEGITLIDSYAFQGCESLKSISFPNSLRYVNTGAFSGCVNAPARAIMMSLCESSDITKSFIFRDNVLLAEDTYWNLAFRRDVFELAVKNDSFRDVEPELLMDNLIRRGLLQYLEIMANSGKLINRATLEAFLEQSMKRSATEFTAYLLEYKRRHFGFGSGDYEL